MKKVTEVTRQDLIDIIKDGFIITYDEPYNHPDFQEPLLKEVDEEINMPFYGRLNEIEFLSRIYDLDNMPSTDSRFPNARSDIWQHTVNNDDWEPFWFFTDRRFKLANGNEDEYILKFISEMLHPAVRKEDSHWKEYLEKFNQILRPDGYELSATKNISGRYIFEAKEIDYVEIEHISEKLYASMKLIGEGSYAQVFKFMDEFYQKSFALKRAKKDLNPKELERFRREFEQMHSLHSPYVVEVYFYNETSNEYVMEALDCTLEKYIKDHNSTINIQERKYIILQLLHGYQYIHSQGIFHRDVSSKNVLMKKYDDTNIFKISDFGLVKIPDSDLTSENTELKGCLNDPALKVKGFDKYDLLDEIYALTLLFVYILTGKTNYGSIKDANIRNFMGNGTNFDRTKRYQNLDELRKGVFSCIAAIS